MGSTSGSGGILMNSYLIPILLWWAVVQTIVLIVAVVVGVSAPVLVFLGAVTIFIWFMAGLAW